MGIRFMEANTYIINIAYYSMTAYAIHLSRTHIYTCHIFSRNSIFVAK